MPIYVMLMNLRDAASNERNGKLAGTHEIEHRIAEGGGVLVARYNDIRPYDFVIVMEARNTTSSAHIVSALRKQGIVEKVMLLGPYASPPYSAFASRFQRRERTVEMSTV